MSKQNLLLKHLNAGKSFTAKQITASFGIKSPAATIRDLREQGHCVYSNAAVVNGVDVVKYRIGSASRRMIALVNSVMGATAFTRQ